MRVAWRLSLPAIQVYLAYIHILAGIILRYDPKNQSYDPRALLRCIDERPAAQFRAT